jgi:hypothetical protein
MHFLQFKQMHNSLIHFDEVRRLAGLDVRPVEPVLPTPYPFILRIAFTPARLEIRELDPELGLAGEGFRFLVLNLVDLLLEKIHFMVRMTDVVLKTPRRTRS